MHREWTAELHALRHDATMSAPARAYQQLRFAVSLATVPPGQPAGTPERGGPSWRDSRAGSAGSSRHHTRGDA